MKKILVFFVSLGILTSCEGPQGPPGFDGEDGVNIVGMAYEFQGSFTSSNNYSLFFEFPNPEDILESDIVMVYALSGVDNGVDIWEPLPQTLFIGDAILTTNFDFTRFDVNVFLDGNADLSTLDPEFTDNKVFRAAVIPVDLIGSINLNSFTDVLHSLNLQTENIQVISGN